MTKTQIDSGSFRDREGRVFYRQGKVYRALSETAASAWQRLSESRFFSREMEAGRLVATHPADLPEVELKELSEHWVMALEHERIPFISYPYEWSFGMLKDAALLQLDLLLAALKEDQILKDATPYNVQWQGASPVFIDIASFEPLRKGDPWVGYLQFCQLFLYPLLLNAHKDVAFHAWLRGSIDGISPEDCNGLFSLRDRLRSGVLTDVYLQAKLKESSAKSDKQVRSEIQQAGFRKEMIVNNVQRLRRIVDGLRWRRASSTWAAYVDTNSYDSDNREVKEAFVAQTAAERHRSLVWDLGCNTGQFSRIASEHADLVVAFDADHLAVEHLYSSLKKDGPQNILPLVSNLADPSPALGWRHAERMSLGQRPHPELILCLALIHHVVISANIPLDDFVAWLGDLGSDLVIEFVTKDDAMVERLLRNKPDIYHDYEVDHFEAVMAKHFEVEECTVYHGETRRLYRARPLRRS